MNATFQLDKSSLSLVSEFFEEFGVRNVLIIPAQDIRNMAISQVDMVFLKEGAKGKSQDYVVSFKLLGQASDIYNYLSSIGSGPTHPLELTQAGLGLGAEAIGEKIRKFIMTIRPRVAKVYKEQSILGTQPLGKTFSLYNKTQFKVLKDDGEGQLTIKIMDKDGGSKEAMLLANDLLDGLYVGAITQL